jgi:hypothetical protein
MFTIYVTNISSNTLRFLDIREGSGWCGEFYEVAVEKDGKTYESNGNCLYAPADVPKIVDLPLGKPTTETSNRLPMWGARNTWRLHARSW